MHGAPLHAVLRQIRHLIGESGTHPSDAQLLRRFVAQRDEQAFAVLVERHGGLVRSVCGRILRHVEDVEDAVQATLIVLARRAATIRNGTSLASSLYGVARRIAWNARRAALRRQQYEQRKSPGTAEQPVNAAALRELQAILNEEVQRLPEKYRTAFVVCCLESKSRADAAAELGWKEGTVAGRLGEARKLLQQRLARRGVSLSAALCAAALGSIAGAADLGVVRAAFMSSLQAEPPGWP